MKKKIVKIKVHTFEKKKKTDQKLVGGNCQRSKSTNKQEIEAQSISQLHAMLT